MKMKKQNAYLSLIGFVQVMFIGCLGAGLNEAFKAEKDLWLIFISFSSSSIALVAVVGMYARVFNKLKKSKIKFL